MADPDMTDATRIPPVSEDDDAPKQAPVPQGTSARIWALIPCAGTGTRAASPVPKQYRQVAGRALVLHTLAAFCAVPRVAHTLVVVAAGDDFFSNLEAPVQRTWASVACGGANRAASVANGLAALQQQGAAEGDWVLVHDAARCLVTPELINRLMDACEGDAVGGLLAQPVSDTLKLGVGLGDTDRVGATRDRSRHWLAQTPQMFRIGMLRSALRAVGEQVTDESSAIEAAGLSPRLVRGSVMNFKVTYPEDFALAHALLMGRGHPAHKDRDYDYP